MATSDTVARLCGRPPPGYGISAASLDPESKFMMKMRLNPPSFFCHDLTAVAPGEKADDSVAKELEIKVDVALLSLGGIVAEPSPTCVMMRIGLDYAFLGEGLRECVRYGDVTRTVALNEVSIGTGRTLWKPHDHVRLKHEKCAT